MKIAYLGIGEMGVGMARNILKKQGALTIWNRTREKRYVDELIAEGAHFEGKIADAVGDADIVCTCLYSGPSTLEIAKETIPAMKKGSILVDLTTIAPSTAEQLAGMYAEAGIDYLDSPVSGGPWGAADGTLSIMIGGSEAAFERARPVYEMIGRIIARMGPSGYGAKTKLINQLITWANQAIVCEGMTLAEEAGLDLTMLYPLLKNGHAQSRMLERSVEPFIIPHTFENHTDAALVLKDMNLLRQMADDLGCEIPIAERAIRFYDQAAEEGIASGNDPAVILTIMERQNPHKNG